MPGIIYLWFLVESDFFRGASEIMGLLSSLSDPSESESESESDDDVSEEDSSEEDRFDESSELNSVLPLKGDD